MLISLSSTETDSHLRRVSSISNPPNSKYEKAKLKALTTNAEFLPYYFFTSVRFKWWKWEFGSHTAECRESCKNLPLSVYWQCYWGTEPTARPDCGNILQEGDCLLRKPHLLFIPGSVGCTGQQCIQWTTKKYNTYIAKRSQLFTTESELKNATRQMLGIPQTGNVLTMMPYFL